MGFSSALLLCGACVAGLFYLDRDKVHRTSKALWLPVIWLWIVGSRPLSVWLGIWLGIGPIGSAGGGLDAQLDGSPADALVFMLLLAIGIAVLSRRGKRPGAILKASTPVIVFFIYALLSVLWSRYPDAAFKRWIKDVGDLVMVLVVVTDPEPIAALRHLFARVGFVLFPCSILLIRYSQLGRGFDPDGNPVNVGVTTNKNTLGLITFIVAVGAFWSFFHLLRAKRQRGRMRQLFAQGALLAFGLAVLATAHSATSIGCFVLGDALILATHLPFIGRRPQRLHALVVTILVIGGVSMLFGGEAVVMGALGRDMTFTGRTDIWKAVIHMCPNLAIGAGFESFWNTYGHDVQGLSIYQKGLNSAHDGYIEVYLNLGLLGVGLIAWILIGGYRRAIAAFGRNQEIGCLMLAYVATSAIYSVTEAGFRILTPTWISLLLAVVASSGSAAGLLASGTPQIRKVRNVPRNVWPVSDDLSLSTLRRDS